VLEKENYKQYNNNIGKIALQSQNCANIKAILEILVPFFDEKSLVTSLFFLFVLLF